MQFTVSFDQRSPKRLVVTLEAGHIVHHSDQPLRTLTILAVQLADLEADGLPVGAHGVTGLVETRTDRDHTTERPPATGHRRYPLVVDPVLEVHNDAVGPRLPMNTQKPTLPFALLVLSYENNLFTAVRIAAFRERKGYNRCLL
jgi:hypothetical protein